ncbi:MAG TPA: hypothetical protein VE011_10305 [Candidatus Dormibacteraeota bacterium]|nr:hypothetical protein [Candidatus Dormibacteraeota bacterium]
MTAIALPDLNQKTIDDLRDRVSKLGDDLSRIDLSKIDLSKIDMPSLQDVGKGADQTIDRLLGRSRAPIWPWIAAGVGLVAVIGAIAAWFTFLRRPSWLGMSPATDDFEGAEFESVTVHAPVSDELRPDELVTSASATSYPIEEA